MAPEITDKHSSVIQKDNNEDSDDDNNDYDDVSFSKSQSPSPSTMNKLEKQQRTLLMVFASLSIFLFAGGIYGWGPMQLLLEANGNFASLCNDDSESGNNSDTDNAICKDRTAAFLNCRFVSQLTFLSGTLWGILSDKYGKSVLVYGFALCNVFGLILLVVAIWFPAVSIIDSPCLYGAFVLMGLGSTVGGMLTVETGLLFVESSKTQNRVISLLNALFDAGAMTYLGLWGLEKITSTTFSEERNADDVNDETRKNLILIIGGYLLMAVVCTGGYTYFFQRINNKNISLIKDNHNKCADEDEEENKTNGIDQKQQITACELGGDDDIIANNHNEGVRTPQSTRKKNLPSSPSNDHQQHHCSYIRIAERSASDQLKSKAYVLMGIYFSFHTISNIWTLTTARDFLGDLGDDAHGNRYLSIFTLMTPISLLALPFLDIVMNRFGFHASLQVVNGLAIAHGIVKVCFKDLNLQILGFVCFTFFRCFLYAVTLSCVATFIGSSVIGRATGTLFVLAGLASLANVGLAQLAMAEESGFFVPNMVFLVGTIPMVYLTYEIGRALETDQRARPDRKISSTREVPSLSVAGDAQKNTIEP
eukprot:CAMPEP_0194144522 /NCGR_PEP_ID=MMETSP0152-20130528/13573_1 /TAXON_ID=1049557 /ORGANISM="Thalassiothrix antarctica, Strain L6-D1" /LENGTH=591 /DNA_ID=CAMNT_0038844419 /DNA_START=100 /DNA_END=1876 /DNA_ORIENTATION=+